MDFTLKPGINHLSQVIDIFTLGQKQARNIMYDQTPSSNRRRERPTVWAPIGPTARR